MTDERRSTFRCVRLAALALVFGIFSSAGAMGVHAQDTPPTVTCESPGLSEAADARSSEDVDELAETDIETEEAVGTAADATQADEIVAAIANYFACYNEGQAAGDPGRYVALESSDFITSQGYDSAEDEAANEIDSAFPTMTLLSTNNAMTWDDGRVSADVQAMVGDHWFNEWRWLMVEEDGIWKLDERVDLPPHPDVDFVSVIGLNITETTDESTGDITYAFESPSGSWEFAQTDAMVFNFTNTGEEVHEAILLQLPEGVDPAGIVDGSIDLSTIAFLGGVFDIEPEAVVDLTMVDLEPGIYTLICLLPGPDDAPHAAHGMVQQVEIVAAEG